MCLDVFFAVFITWICIFQNKLFPRPAIYFSPKSPIALHLAQISPPFNLFSYPLGFQLLSLIVTRPLVELRHFFDLIKHLLRVKDELQSSRVLAVLCGLRGPAWHLRPTFQSGRIEGEAIFGDTESEECDGDADGEEDPSSRYPEPPDYAQPGLLSWFLIRTTYCFICSLSRFRFRMC